MTSEALDGDFGGGDDGGGGDGGPLDLNDNGSIVEELIMLNVLTDGGRGEPSPRGNAQKGSGGGCGCIMPALLVVSLVALVGIAG
ncbi:MAG: hypothetical protein ACKN9R_04610 [Candidatus Limnocylindrus sp.]